MTRKSGRWWDITLGAVDGCTHSGRPGCDNCWAHGMADRFWGDRKFSDIQLHPERLKYVTRWRKPRYVFVAPMGDLFHEKVPYEFVDLVMATISVYRQHKFFVLTKRPGFAKIYFNERMKGEWVNIYLESAYKELGLYPPSVSIYPFPNMILCASISTQKDADEMLPYLAQTQVARRGVSIEPVLEGIELYKDLTGDGRLLIDCLDWVSVGCESGSSRRHVDDEVFRSLRDQCFNAGVNLFIKQMEVDGKVVHGPELDGFVWDEMPW